MDISTKDLDLIAKCAIAEIYNKAWGVTGQFLEIHELEYAERQPRIAGINTDRFDDTAVVYFAVKDEDFFFAVYVNTQSDIKVTNVEVEPHNIVYFLAHSDDMNVATLCSLISLQPSETATKGDKRPTGFGIHKTNTIVFEPQPGPGDFEGKLDKLLDHIEKDPDGIKQLVAQANGKIASIIIAHNGNGLLGGHTLSKSAIKRLAALDLSVEIGVHATGNKWL